jgi:hypothetical protein
MKATDVAAAIHHNDVMNFLQYDFEFAALPSKSAKSTHPKKDDAKAKANGSMSAFLVKKSDAEEDDVQDEENADDDEQGEDEQGEDEDEGAENAGEDDAQDEVDGVGSAGEDYDQGEENADDHSE